MGTRERQGAAWPEGVIARYLTVAGATVDVSCEKPGSTYVDGLACTGCNYSEGWQDETFARQEAQSHAEKCRALPKPGGER